MFHNLHVGFLDPIHVVHREVRVVRAFPPDPLHALLSKYGDITPNGTVSFLGERVFVDDGYVVCPWLHIGENLATVRFALEAIDAFPGCIVADLGHGRVVERGELEESVNGQDPGPFSPPSS